MTAGNNRAMAFIVIATFAFSFLLLAGTAHARLTITATLKATPGTYTGKCPAVIKFDGVITVTGVTNPAKVQYKFIRSDGALAPVETLTFDRDGSKNVSETWTLGGAGLPTYSGWEAIRIVYPQELESNKANFKIECKDGTPPPQSLQEDCLSFNPQSAATKLIGSSWKIVDGSHWLFDFGGKKPEADKALAIIKRYRMNQTCFVGRPGPSFSYLLASGKAPAGGFQGEDCVSFNPATTEVKMAGGSWKMVDGSHSMFDFGTSEAEARQSLAIIMKYGFTHSCFVGRPDPSFQYLRK